MLRLQEQGKLTALKIKWWKEKRGGGACSVSGQDLLTGTNRKSKVSSWLFIGIRGRRRSSGFGIGQCRRLFLLLVAGSFMAMLINFIQFLLFVKKQADDNDVSGGDALYSSSSFLLFFSSRYDSVTNSRQSLTLFASGRKWQKNCATVNHPLLPATRPRSTPTQLLICPWTHRRESLRGYRRRFSGIFERLLHIFRTLFI